MEDYNTEIKVEHKQSESQRAMNSMQGTIVCVVIFGVIAYLVSYIYKYIFGKILFVILILLIIICAMFGISFFLDWKAAKKLEKIEAEALEEEKELAKISPEQRALRAEKLFKINQKELMRYYDMNLAQTKFLSVLGIVMILFGIVIVGMSFGGYVYLKEDRVVLVVGNVCGIIVDFVGAIFIKMYTKNIEASVSFHAKFAESNHLLLANSIANKIENEELRETTLSEIAKDIVISDKKF